MCFEIIHLLPRQSEDILEIVKENTGVELEYRKDTEVVIMTGTFDQIEEAHKLLQYLVSQQMKREKKVASYGDIDDFSKFEVQPLFMKLLKRVLIKKLQEIEEKSCVKIRCDENMSQVFIRPSKITAKQNHFQEGCDAFIDLYQKFIPNIGREEVYPPKDADTAFIQEAVATAEAENPMIIEKTEGLLVVYAQKKSMKKSVQSLKEELGLTIDKDGKKAKPRQGNKRFDASSKNEIPQQGQHSLTQHLKHELSNKVKLALYQGDITDERVDAIVNAANEWLRHGGGVAAAIVSKGGRQIQVESTWIVQQYGPLDVGRATYTCAGNLPCRYVIHTVGPEWKKHGKENCKHFLHRACLESLHIAAVDLELTSIALTAISSGIFGMPKEICAQIMLSAVEAFSSSEEAEFSTLRDVRIVIIDEPTLSVFQEEFVKRYLSKEPSPKTLPTRESLSDEDRVTPLTPHSPVDEPEDSSPLTDETQGSDDNSLQGQRKENIDGSSPPNNLTNNKNSPNVTVSGSMKQGSIPHQATHNFKNENVSQGVSESPNVGYDRGEKGDASVPSPHSAVDKRKDSSLLKDESQGGDENNPLVGERQENRDGNSQLDNVKEAENSADITVPNSVNGEDSSPLTDETQGSDDNSLQGQRKENIDGSSPPNNLTNNKNSPNVTVSGSMKQGSIPHQATHNFKNENVSQGVSESPNVGYDRGEKGDASVPSPHSAVDKRKDSSLLKDESQGGDENNPLVGERQENRDGNSQLDNVKEAENSADITVPNSVNGGSSPHQANEHLKTLSEPESVNEAPNKEKSHEKKGNGSSSVEGFAKSDGGNVGKSVFGKGRGNLAPNFQNSPGKERSATTNGNAFVESTSTTHGRDKGSTTTFSPLGLDVTKEGKQPAQLHEMREGGDQNEMEVCESQRSGMIQNPKSKNQDSDACNPVDSSRAISTEKPVTDESHISDHQDLKNSLTSGEMMPNQGESSLESEGYANDGNEESPSTENTENAKPNGELPPKGHNESSQDRLTLPPKEAMMQEAFKSSGQGECI